MTLVVGAIISFNITYQKESGEQQLGFQNRMLALAVEGGYGYEESELDNTGQEDDSTSYYIQAKLTLAPGVYITPEIGIADHGKDRNGAKEAETTYYGCKWQISF